MTSPNSDQVQRLVEEVRLLRQVIDELREELRWANNNCQDPGGLSGRPYRLTSLPLDPGEPNWGGKVNTVDEATVERFREDAVGLSSRPSTQQCLFK